MTLKPKQAPFCETESTASDVERSSFVESGTIGAATLKGHQRLLSFSQSGYRFYPPVRTFPTDEFSQFLMERA